MAVERLPEMDPGLRALDVREEILKRVPAERFCAAIVADEEGIVAGMRFAGDRAATLGLSLEWSAEDGHRVGRGYEIMRFSGSPRQIAMAEETLVGLLAKPSGIATNARRFVDAAGGRPAIVCGAWKKMPGALKEMIRGAVLSGGASVRIVPGDFAYLDKNYVRMLGGIRKSLAAVAHLEGHSKVVQIKGRYGDVSSEACEAADAGADVVFIDTGRPEDVPAATRGLARAGLRDRVKLAFGGGVGIGDVAVLKTFDLDILDVGRRIVDAPLLDMRLDIIGAKG